MRSPHQTSRVIRLGRDTTDLRESILAEIMLGEFITASLTRHVFTIVQQLNAVAPAIFRLIPHAGFKRNFFALYIVRFSGVDPSRWPRFSQYVDVLSTDRFADLYQRQGCTVVRHWFAGGRVKQEDIR